jgi:hypothetical protein
MKTVPLAADVLFTRHGEPAETSEDASILSKTRAIVSLSRGAGLTIVPAAPCGVITGGWADDGAGNPRCNFPFLLFTNTLNPSGIAGPQSLQGTGASPPSSIGRSAPVRRLTLLIYLFRCKLIYK